MPWRTRSARRTTALLVGILVGMLAVPVPGGAAVDEGESSVHLSVVTNGVADLPPPDEVRVRVFIHEERPGHRRPVSLCQPTTNDQVASFAPTGWQLPAGGLTYVVNLERAPEGIRGAVDDALARAAAAWAGADTDKQLRFGGRTVVSRPRYDGTHLVSWRPLPRRTIGLAIVWYHPQTDEVLDADIVFNSRAPWAVNDPTGSDCAGTPTAYDVQAVATHEFGHWIGLDDLSAPAALDLTMYGFVTGGELKKVSLGAGDVLGAQELAP